METGGQLRFGATFGRVAGIAAAGSGLCGVGVIAAQIVTGTDDAPISHWLGAGFNLLLLPAAFSLWRSLGRSLPLTIATAAGAGSLLLWAAHQVVRPIGQMETIWIWLAALWWLGLGAELRASHPRTGLFTLLVGLAAVLDGIVSTPGLDPPFLVFALLGAWKIPLSFAWAFVIAVALIKASRPPRATDLPVRPRG